MAHTASVQDARPAAVHNWLQCTMELGAGVHGWMQTSSTAFPAPALTQLQRPWLYHLMQYANMGGQWAANAGPSPAIGGGGVGTGFIIACTGHQQTRTARVDNIATNIGLPRNNMTRSYTAHTRSYHKANYYCSSDPLPHQVCRQASHTSTGYIVYNIMASVLTVALVSMLQLRCSYSKLQSSFASRLARPVPELTPHTRQQVWLQCNCNAALLPRATPQQHNLIA
jgi:hypothetical protein